MIARLEVDGAELRNHLIPAAARSHDATEMLQFGALVDAAAFERLEVACGTDRVSVRLHVSPAGPLLPLLAATAAPHALLGAVPADADLAIVLGAGNLLGVWQHLRAALPVRRDAPGNLSELDRLKENMRRQTGVDLETDVFANLTAMAFVVPTLRQPRDLERRGALLLETRDRDRAREALQRFLVAARLDPAKPVSESATATVWSSADGRVALAASMIVAGPVANNASGVDSVLAQLTGQASALAPTLTARYPKGTGFGVVNLAALAREPGLPRLTAGIWIEDSTLALDADLGGAVVARMLARLLREQAQQAERAACMNALRQIGLACRMYATDFNDAWPADLGQLVEKHYLTNPAILRCPASGQPYVYRTELAGASAKAPPQPGQKTVVAYDAPGAHPDGGAVLFADGHVEWLATDRFDQVTAAAAPPPAP